MENMEERLREISIKWEGTIYCLIGVPEEKNKEEVIFKEINGWEFSRPVRQEWIPQIKELQSISSRGNK